MATYYVATTGSNSNNGSAGSPWATLAWASTHASSGDIIHINAGNYTIASQIAIPVGVSIEGDGNTTVLNSTVSSDYTLLLSSGTQGTNGNQHIYNIKMSGGSGLNSYSAYSPINVTMRSNVEILNCTFQYFSYRGPMFAGTSTDGQPSTYSTGNSFHDNIVLDCCNFVNIGDPYGSGQGCLEIGGQQGMLVYNNTITVSYRTGGLNGYNIKYCMNGYNKGLKVYNNIFIRPPFSGISNDFDFSMELWNCRGGIEIYGNTMSGSIDMSGDHAGYVCNDEGGYGFAAKIHHNTIGWDTWQDHEQMGVDIERAHTGGMYIYNNLFKKLTTPIKTYQGYDSRFHDIVEDIYVYYNIADGIGNNTNQYGTAFFATGSIPVDANGIIYRRIYILNNTIIAGTGSYGTEAGINFSIKGSVSYVEIKNNIIVGFGDVGDGGAIFIDGTSLTSFTNFALQNNIFYDNKRNSVMLYAGANPSYSVNSGNLTTVPPFVSTSDYHLTEERAGVSVTLPTAAIDYDGSAVATPSIGAYEYGGVPPDNIPVTAVTVTGAGGSITISTDNGTLQMSAHIDPHDATDQTVVWSVTNGTGSASINSSGLLTAITDGTVTVKATSNG